MDLQSLGRPTCNPTMFLYHRDGGHHPDRWNVPTITVTYTLVKENTVTGNDLRCRTLLLCCARFRPFLSENHRYRAFRCKSTYLKKMFAIGDSEFPPWKLSKLCHPVCLLYVQRSCPRRELRRKTKVLSWTTGGGTWIFLSFCSEEAKTLDV